MVHLLQKKFFFAINLEIEPCAGVDFFFKETFGFCPPPFQIFNYFLKLALRGIYSGWVLSVSNISYFHSETAALGNITLSGIWI